MAGAALMLAINISQSEVAKQIGLPHKLKNLNMKSSFYQFENAETFVEPGIYENK